MTHKLMWGKKNMDVGDGKLIFIELLEKKGRWEETSKQIQYILLTCSYDAVLALNALFFTLM